MAVVGIPGRHPLATDPPAWNVMVDVLDPSGALQRLDYASARDLVRHVPGWHWPDNGGKAHAAAQKYARDRAGPRNTVPPEDKGTIHKRRRGRPLSGIERARRAALSGGRAL